MNKDFEKLPEIAKILKDLHHTIIWFGADGLYHTSFNLTDEVCFLNGALYAYQEQQKDYVCDCGFLDTVDEPDIVSIDNLKDAMLKLSSTLSVFGKEAFINELDDLMLKNGINLKQELLK